MPNICRRLAAGSADACDEILRVCDSLFRDDEGMRLLEAALATLESRHVRNCVTTPSERQWSMCSASRGNTQYLTLGHYCTCDSFLHQIRKPGLGPPVCKHMLAARLGPGLGFTTEQQVEDTQVGPYLVLPK